MIKVTIGTDRRDANYYYEDLEQALTTTAKKYRAKFDDIDEWFYHYITKPGYVEDVENGKRTLFYGDIGIAVTVGTLKDDDKDYEKDLTKYCKWKLNIAPLIYKDKVPTFEQWIENDEIRYQTL